MRYYKVIWTDAHNVECMSDPLTTWLDAARYRIALIVSGIRPDQVRIVGPY